MDTGLNNVLTMSNYICIGLIARESEINDVASSFVKGLDDYSFISVKYPIHGNLNEWNSLDETQCSTEEALNICIEYDSAYSLSNFKVKEFLFRDIIFSFEKCVGQRICFLIHIPSDDLLMQGVDAGEGLVVELLKRAQGFMSGFCDCEAHADEERYAISVQYRDKPIISYERWRIDGLTERLDMSAEETGVAENLSRAGN